MMLSDEKMLAVVTAYFDLFNAGDGAAIANLFADKAEVHDPVGTPPKVGAEAIHDFYAKATRGRARLEQMGPTRIAGQSAAFAFRVHVKGISSGQKAVDVDVPTGPMTIDVIDAFDFDETGKILTMRAYWGPSNISQ